MSLTRVCKKPAGRIQRQPVSAPARDPRDIRIVANETSGVMAVLIPDGLSPLHRIIAMSIGSESNRFSQELTDLWRLGEVWGSPQYIETMEAFVTPPIPRHSVLRIA